MTAAPHRSPVQPERRHLGPADNWGKNKLWTDLFRNTNKPSSAFQLRKWSEEDRALSKEDLRIIGFCLVGHVLGRFPGRNAVEKVRRTWNVDSSYSIHENGWLIFRFSSDQDRESVLRNGPYDSFGAPWLLKKLPPFFKFSDISFNNVPTWIRLRGLPLECWTEIALGKLASFVGEPLAADDCTATMSRSSFARILVEVDISKPLVREIRTSLPDGSMLVQEVIFEREPRLCTKCKRIGHTEEQCRSIRKRHQLVDENPLSSTEEGVRVMQMPGDSGAAGNQAGKKKQMLTAKGAGALSSYPIHANKKQQEAASTATAAAAECVTPHSAKEVQPMVDMQEALPTPANPKAVTQLQNQVNQSAAREPNVTEIVLPRLQQPVDAPESSSHYANKLQHVTELQASSSAPAIAAELGSPYPATEEQRLVDVHGEASTHANPSVATQLQKQVLILAAEQHKDATEIQPPHEANSTATRLVAGQVQEQPSMDAKSGQARRLTRNSSAAMAAVGTALMRQASQYDSAATAVTTAEHADDRAMLLADQAVLQADPDAKSTTMPKQQKCQNKWQTMKTRSGKKKR